MQTRSSTNIDAKHRRPAKTTRLKAMSVAIAVSCISLTGAALAADSSAKTLRICAATNEGPYSTGRGDGFENRIAEIVAGAMGRKADFVWSEKPAIYLVRDQLDKDNCDVVMGVDSGDERVLTTKPYYRAPYVFIERADSKFDITSFDSPDLMKVGKIGYIPGSSAEVMMKKLDLFGVNFNYVKSLSNFKSPRNQYVRIDPSRLIAEVAAGNSDLVIAFSPQVARYVKAQGNKLKMVVVPDNNVRVDGEKVPFHFSQSMGVRKDDAKLLGELNKAIVKAHSEIEAVLKKEGIPLEPTASKS